MEESETRDVAQLSEQPRDRSLLPTNLSRFATGETASTRYLNYVRTAAIHRYPFTTDSVSHQKLASSALQLIRIATHLSHLDQPLIRGTPAMGTRYYLVPIVPRLGAISHSRGCLLKLGHKLTITDSQ